MHEHDIAPIDLVIVNLYPFRETIDKPGVTLEEAVENIDIGGPALVRAAAKNYESVGVVVSPADYPEVITAIERGAFDLELRQRLMAKAFDHTADYDRAIANHFTPRFGAQADGFPQHYHADYQLHSVLRYGENPHQQAAFYTSRKAAGATLATAKQIQGKALSYNNLADADAALQTVLRFPRTPRLHHRQTCQPLRRRAGRQHPRRLRRRAPLRQHLGLWRHHRLQPRPGRRDRARNHQPPVR